MAMECTLTVISNETVADGIKKLVLALPPFTQLPEIHAGQFLQVRIPDSGHVLRRPLCIADFDHKDNTVTVIYQIKGGGTTRLVSVGIGEALNVLLPLGNGFKLPADAKKIMLVAGGMGAAIVPAVFREYGDRDIYLYMGFSRPELAICGELSARAKKSVIISSGFITDNISNDLQKLSPDAVISCGPVPLYRAMKKTFADFKNPVQVSLEEHMCCGIGACYVCACKIKKGDSVYTMRVCKDGPCFSLWEVEL